MLEGVTDMVKQKPVTTGLVVIGVCALGFFALNGGGAQAADDGTLNGTVISGPSDAQVAANTSALIAQQQSADARYLADLNAKTTLAGRAIQSSETMAQIQFADRVDTRRYDEAINLQGTQLAVAREQATTDRTIAGYEAGVATTNSNNARRANRDNNTGSIISGIATLAAFAFGI